MESKNFDMFKNFGINENIFNMDLDSEKTKDIYVILKDPMKKNFSEGAIHKVPSNLLQNNLKNPKDDIEIYEECDQEYSVFDTNTNDNFNTKTPIPTYSEVTNLFTNSSSLNKNKNNIFSSFSNLKNLEEESYQKNQNQNKNKFLCSSSILNFNEENFQEEKESENLVKENQEEIRFISKKDEDKKKEINKYEKNSERNLIDLKMKNGIMKNSQEYQMEQLDRIFKEMNEDNETRVIIKAYKSKLKTKFYKVYESNSEFYKEKNKLKIFHKCNFPGCNRTFASAGWLKSHFAEHIEEIKLNKFNIEFERCLNKLRYKQLLN
jgi:hypothetical protein